MSLGKLGNTAKWDRFAAVQWCFSASNAAVAATAHGGKQKFAAASLSCESHRAVETPSHVTPISGNLCRWKHLCSSNHDCSGTDAWGGGTMLAPLAMGVESLSPDISAVASTFFACYTILVSTCCHGLCVQSTVKLPCREIPSALYTTIRYALA